MVYCTFLLIPSWGAGVVYFILNEESHKLAVTEFVLMSLAYICLPAIIFTGLQLKLQKVTKNQPDSDSSASSDEEVIKNKEVALKNSYEGLLVNSSEYMYNNMNLSKKDSLY